MRSESSITPFQQIMLQNDTNRHARNVLLNNTYFLDNKNETILMHTESKPNYSMNYVEENRITELSVKFQIKYITTTILLNNQNFKMKVQRK